MITLREILDARKAQDAGYDTPDPQPPMVRMSELLAAGAQLPQASDNPDMPRLSALMNAGAKPTNIGPMSLQELAAQSDDEEGYTPQPAAPVDPRADIALMQQQQQAYLQQLAASQAQQLAASQAQPQQQSQPTPMGEQGAGGQIPWMDRQSAEAQQAQGYDLTDPEQVKAAAEWSYGGGGPMPANETTTGGMPGGVSPQDLARLQAIASSQRPASPQTAQPTSVADLPAPDRARIAARMLLQKQEPSSVPGLTDDIEPPQKPLPFDAESRSADWAWTGATGGGSRPAPVIPATTPTREERLAHFEQLVSQSKGITDVHSVRYGSTSTPYESGPGETVAGAGTAVVKWVTSILADLSDFSDDSRKAGEDRAMKAGGQKRVQNVPTSARQLHNYVEDKLPAQQTTYGAVGEFIGQTIPLLLLGAKGVRMALGAVGLQTFSASYKQQHDLAIQQGMDPDQAFKRATFAAAIETVVVAALMKYHPAALQSGPNVVRNTVRAVLGNFVFGTGQRAGKQVAGDLSGIRQPTPADFFDSLKGDALTALAFEGTRAVLSAMGVMTPAKTINPRNQYLKKLHSDASGAELSQLTTGADYVPAQDRQANPSPDAPGPVQQPAERPQTSGEPAVVPDQVPALRGGDNSGSGGSGEPAGESGGRRTGGIVGKKQPWEMTEEEWRKEKMGTKGSPHAGDWSIHEKSDGTVVVEELVDQRPVSRYTASAQEAAEYKDALNNRMGQGYTRYVVASNALRSKAGAPLIGDHARLVEDAAARDSVKTSSQPSASPTPDSPYRIVALAGGKYRPMIKEAGRWTFAGMPAEFSSKEAAQEWVAQVSAPPAQTLADTGRQPQTLADTGRQPPATPRVEAPQPSVSSGAEVPVAASPTSRQQEPPVAPGMVRFYHGGVEYAGGSRWLTQHRVRAEDGYARNGRTLQYVDIPEGHPSLLKEWDDSGTSQVAPFVDFNAPESIARGLKPLSQEQSHAVQEPRTETSSDGPVEIQNSIRPTAGTDQASKPPGLAITVPPADESSRVQRSGSETVGEPLLAEARRMAPNWKVTELPNSGIRFSHPDGTGHVDAYPVPTEAIHPSGDSEGRTDKRVRIVDENGNQRIVGIDYLVKLEDTPNRRPQVMPHEIMGHWVMDWMFPEGTKGRAWIDKTFADKEALAIAWGNWIAGKINRDIKLNLLIERNRWFGLACKKLVEIGRAMKLKFSEKERFFTDVREGNIEKAGGTLDRSPVDGEVDEDNFSKRPKQDEPVKVNQKAMDWLINYAKIHNAHPNLADIFQSVEKDKYYNYSAGPGFRRRYSELPDEQLDKVMGDIMERTSGYKVIKSNVPQTRSEDSPGAERVSGDAKTGQPNALSKPGVKFDSQGRPTALPGGLWTASNAHSKVLAAIEKLQKQARDFMVKKDPDHPDRTQWENLPITAKELYESGSLTRAESGMAAAHIRNQLTKAFNNLAARGGRSLEEYGSLPETKARQAEAFQRTRSENLAKESADFAKRMETLPDYWLEALQERDPALRDLAENPATAGQPWNRKKVLKALEEMGWDPVEIPHWQPTRTQAAIDAYEYGQKHSEELSRLSPEGQRRFSNPMYLENKVARDGALKMLEARIDKSTGTRKEWGEVQRNATVERAKAMKPPTSDELLLLTPKARTAFEEMNGNLSGAMHMLSDIRADTSTITTEERRLLSRPNQAILENDTKSGSAKMKLWAEVRKIRGESGRDIQLFHGSGVNPIENFNNDNFGTGEGSKRLGWGTNLSTSKEFATEYARIVGEVTLHGNPITESETTGNDAESMAKRYVRDARNITEARLLAADDLKSELASEDPAYKAKVQAALDIIEGWKKSGAITKKGTLYNVGIQSAGSDLLDLDKPLSQQPGELTELLRDFSGKSSDDMDAMTVIADAVKKDSTAFQLYHGLSNALGSDKSASLFLKNKIGIPGARAADYHSGALSLMQQLRDPTTTPEQVEKIKGKLAEIRKQSDSMAKPPAYTYVMYDDSLAKIKSSESTETNFSKRPSAPSTDDDGVVTKVYNYVKDRVGPAVLPEMSRLGQSSADAAVQHASAHIAIEPWVNSLLGKVFGKATQAEREHVIDILNMDQVLDGFDAYKAIANDPSANGRVRDNALRTATEIDATHPLHQYEAEVMAAIHDPDVKQYIDNWKRVINPGLDRLYREMKAQSPLTPPDPRGKYTGTRLNLVSKEAAAEWADGDPMVAGASSNSHRNPAAKKDQWDRRATFTGDYTTNPEAILSTVLGRRWNEVTKLRLYDAMVRDGMAMWQEDGAAIPENYVPFSVEVPETSDAGATRQVKKALMIDPRVKRELRDALNTDMSLAPSKLAQQMTKIQVIGVTDAVAHALNIWKVISRSLGSGSKLYDALRQTPVGGLDALARIVKTAYNVAVPNQQTRDYIADMARQGLLRPKYESWMQGMVQSKRPWLKALAGGTHEFLYTVDTAARVTMSKFFDTLVANGQAVDSASNRRDFVNQIGQYNRRLMGEWAARARDSGLSPFIVAGRTMNMMGRRTLFGTPGFKATSWSEATQARMIQLVGPLSAALVIAPIANYLLTGKMTGRPGTPLGAIDLGTDEDDGKHKILDLMQFSGARRGMRSTGIDAVVEGTRQGKSRSQIINNWFEQFFQAGLHPVMGPAVSMSIKAITGHQPDLRGSMEAREVIGNPVGQRLEYARAALESQNPLIYALLGSPGDDKSLGVGEAMTKTAKSGIGIKDVNRGSDAAEDMARDLYTRHFGPMYEDAARDEKSKTLRQIVDAYRANKPGAQKLFDDAVGAKVLGKGDIPTLKGKIQAGNNLDYQVSKLSVPDAMRVFDVATDAEKKRLCIIIGTKLKKAMDKGELIHGMTAEQMNNAMTKLVKWAPAAK